VSVTDPLPPSLRLAVQIDSLWPLPATSLRPPHSHAAASHAPINANGSVPHQEYLHSVGDRVEKPEVTAPSGTWQQ